MDSTTSTELIKIEDDFPPLHALPAGTILGYHHYRTPRKEIIIPKRYVVSWGERLDTQTRITREWMSQLPRVVRKRDVCLMSAAAQAPLYARPGYFHDAVYVDITAAYPSIYQRIGWNVEYKRFSYLSLTEPFSYPFPMEWKIGRSMPVAQTNRGWSKYWTGKSVEVRQFLNRHWNPSIRLATLDVLQAIAWQAVNVYGAAYVNVDGAVLPAETADAYQNFLSGLGLSSKIKHSRGPAIIAGTHALNISGKQIGAGMAVPKPYSNLIFEEFSATWLLSKFSRR